MNALEFLASLPGSMIDLTAISADTGKIRGRTFAKGNASDRTNCALWIEQATAKRFGVYFNINSLGVRLGIDKRNGETIQKANEPDVTMLNAFHVDGDVSKDIGDPTAFAEAKAELLRAIQGMNKPPSIIIDSGNGYGLFWMLRKGIKVTAANRDQLKAINIALRDAVRSMPGGSADACQNLDRVMRMPFTINYPNAAKLKRGRVEVATDLIADDRDLGDVFYTLEDFDAATVEAPPLAPDVVEAIDIPDTVDLSSLTFNFRKLIETGPKEGQKIGDGTRSDYAFYVAAQLIEGGFTEGQIVKVLTNPDFKVSEHVLAQTQRGGETEGPINQAIKIIGDAKKRGAKFGEALFEADAIDSDGLEAITAEWQKRDAARRERRKATWDTLRRDYAYITEQEVFVERNGDPNSPPSMFTVRGFNNAFGYLKTDLRIKGSLSEYIFTTPPGQGFDQFKSFCYMPGKPEDFGGKLNLYRKPPLVPAEGDVSWFTDHVEWMFGDDSAHVLNWCSWVYRYQHLHPKHALLTHGEHQGTGKSVIANSMRKLLGSGNCTLLDQSALSLDHDGWKVRTKLLIIEEVRPAFGSSNEIAKKLHPLISEDVVHVDMKNRNDFDMPNVIAVLEGSNKRDALTMDDSDRRQLIVSTDRDGKVLKPRDRDYYRAIYGKNGVGGKLNDPAALAALAWYMLNRDLKGYSAQDPAPFTAAKGAMIEAGGGELQKWIRDNAEYHPLNKPLVRVADIVAHLNQDASDIVRRHRGNLRSDIEDILRRKRNGRPVKMQLRPWGRNGDQVRVWAIDTPNGPNAEKLAAMKLGELNAIFRAAYPRHGGKVEDFEDADA